jgi:hypothetical protein
MLELLRRECAQPPEFVCWKFDGKVVLQQHAQCNMLIEPGQRTKVDEMELLSLQSQQPSCPSTNRKQFFTTRRILLRRNLDIIERFPLAKIVFCEEGASALRSSWGDILHGFPTR